MSFRDALEVRGRQDRTYAWRTLNVNARATPAEHVFERRLRLCRSPATALIGDGQIASGGGFEQM
jgi:hypothetical protein